MKKRVALLALTLVLGTSVAFGWTHFFSYSYNIPARATYTTKTFTADGNFTLSHSQSVPNIVLDGARVKVTIWKGNEIVKTDTVTGDNVTKLIAVSSGKGTYKVVFQNLVNCQVDISGSAMK